MYIETKINEPGGLGLSKTGLLRGNLQALHGSCLPYPSLGVSWGKWLQSWLQVHPPGTLLGQPLLIPVPDWNRTTTYIATSTFLVKYTPDHASNLGDCVGLHQLGSFPCWGPLFDPNLFRARFCCNFVPPRNKVRMCEVPNACACAKKTTPIEHVFLKSSRRCSVENKEVSLRAKTPGQNHQPPQQVQVFRLCDTCQPPALGVSGIQYPTILHRRSSPSSDAT